MIHDQFCPLTVLHSIRALFKILKANMTIMPAMIAFVVAIAGMMFPAMANRFAQIKG